MSSRHAATDRAFGSISTARAAAPLDPAKARCGVPSEPRDRAQDHTRPLTTCPTHAPANTSAGSSSNTGCSPNVMLFSFDMTAGPRKPLERVNDPQNLGLARRYIRWHHQRRMNLMEEVTRGTYLRAKQEVTVAIDLLDWLTSHDL